MADAPTVPADRMEGRYPPRIRRRIQAALLVAFVLLLALARATD